MEIIDHLVERQPIDHHGPRTRVGQIRLHPPAFLAQGEDRAQVIVGHEDRRPDPGLLDARDLHGVRHVRGIVKLQRLAAPQMHPVNDAGGGGDEIEVELARKALLDDLEVQKPQEAAAKAEPEGGRGLRAVLEARVVEPELRQALAQALVIDRFGREQAAEDDRDRRLEAGQGLGRRAPVLGDGVAHPALRDVLDARGDEADLAGAERGDLRRLGGENADPLDLARAAGRHHADLHALAQRPVVDAE